MWRSLPALAVDGAATLGRVMGESWDESWDESWGASLPALAVDGPGREPRLAGAKVVDTDVEVAGLHAPRDVRGAGRPCSRTTPQQGTAT